VGVLVRDSQIPPGEQNMVDMRIAVLGTGMVGRAIASRLSGLGHEVVVGTRDVEKTLARGDAGDLRLLTFADAGAFGDIIVNATNGANALAALNAVGEQNLAGKVVLDLALPLDLSSGLPPTLTVANTDSLGEQVQRAFPSARVVKSLTTVYFQIMIDPSRIPGEHSIFVAGDDADAKSVVQGLLAQFGWPEGSIIDLGGIAGARGVEMYSRLFFELYQAFGTFDFNINVVRPR
jgi:predicted dinucleotide-binding enzyme